MPNTQSRKIRPENENSFRLDLISANFCVACGRHGRVGEFLGQMPVYICIRVRHPFIPHANEQICAPGHTGLFFGAIRRNVNQNCMFCSLLPPIHAKLTARHGMQCICRILLISTACRRCTGTAGATASHIYDIRTYV